MNPRIFLGILSAVVGLLAVINPQSSIEAIVILRNRRNRKRNQFYFKSEKIFVFALF